MSYITFENVTKEYRTGGEIVRAANCVSFDMEKGELCVVLGPSGAGKTTILIAHRISTVEQMDRILFLEDGKISGFDTHEALCRTNEAYRKMVDLQKLEEGGGENE